MLNKIVNHVKFGEGKIVEVIDRSAPSIKYDEKTGEVKTVNSNLPNILIIEFKDGDKRKFQDVALKNEEWFVQEKEVENKEEIEEILE